jgi:hypothetical protein
LKGLKINSRGKLFLLLGVEKPATPIRRSINGGTLKENKSDSKEWKHGEWKHGEWKALVDCPVPFLCTLVLFL